MTAHFFYATFSCLLRRPTVCRNTSTVQQFSFCTVMYYIEVSLSRHGFQSTVGVADNVDSRSQLGGLVVRCGDVATPSPLLQYHHVWSITLFSLEGYPYRSHGKWTVIAAAEDVLTSLRVRSTTTLEQYTAVIPRHAW